MVAASALERVLADSGGNKSTYLDAIRQGDVQRLAVNLKSSAHSGHDADTTENLNAIASALAHSIPAERTCHVLSICTGHIKLPASICQIHALAELDLKYCTELVEIPANIGNLVHLRVLRLNFCAKLQSLPDLPTALKELTLVKCSSLQNLAKNLGQLITLSQLNMDGCKGLLSLPDSIGELSSLTDLNMSRCETIGLLPESLNKLHSLTSLNLDGCKRLSSLLGQVCGLVGLERLNFCNCTSLVTLPDLSIIPGLDRVDAGLNHNETGAIYVRGVDAEMIHAWKAYRYAPGCHGYGVSVCLCPWLKHHVNK